MTGDMASDMLLNALPTPSARPEKSRPFKNSDSLLPASSIAGANWPIRAFLALVTASPTLDITSCSFTWFSRASMMALLLFRNESAASLYVPESVSMISWFRSDSLPHAASFSLNSSSEMPAQFRASASTPTTVPVLEVSFAASMRELIGSASPNVPITPVAMFVHVPKSS